MIFTHSVNYNFKKALLKIHYFCPAFDDSVVLIAQKQHDEDYLLHFDKHSQLVYWHQFKDYVDTLCMPNDRHAIVLRPEEGLILLFDLLKKTKKEIKHYYFTDVSCQIDVDFFCQTNLLCIRENGDHDEQKIMLTYYPWPLKLQNGQEEPPTIFNQFIGEGEIWDPSYRVQKINAHSKYAWNQTRFQNQFRVRLHEIRNGKSHYQEVSVKMNPLFKPYGMANMVAAIVEMWEFQPEVLLLFCASSKNHHQELNPQMKALNNTFIWDTNLGTIRESKFLLPPKYQDLQVDIYGSPSLSMFRTFYFQPGKGVPSPAYFVDNRKEEIIYEEEWTCSHIQKYRVLERDRNAIIEGVFQNINVEKLSIRIIGLQDRRVMSLHLLKQMKDKPRNSVETWDADLLRDIFDRLDYEQSQ